MPETDVPGDPFREIWYVHENVVLGGWDVTTSGQPPSPTRYEGRTRIGYFLKEPFARRVADLHSADLAGRLLPEGGETRTEWGVGPDSANVEVSPGEGEGHARNLAAIDGSRVFVRQVGPWVAVDQEDTGG